MMSIERCSDDDTGSDAKLTTDALLTLLSGANVGLAVFDPGLDLAFANARYVALCGYSDTEARRGRNLRDLARLSMLRAGFNEAVIQQQIDSGLRRLRAAGAYSFGLRSPSGASVFVHRQILPGGGVAETVQEALAQPSNHNADHLEIMAHAARTRLAHALESMADGFALFDADDRLVLYNRRYVELKPRVEDLIAPGISYEELLRASVERSGYVTGEMDAADYIAWRLDQHRTPDQAYDVETGDGRWIRVRERRTEDGGVVGTRSDITELKRREAEILSMSGELAHKNMLFDTALNNMIQGLCMFDAEQRLIVCNRRYLEMYGFSPEVVKPGVKLDEIMAYSVSLGNYTSTDASRAMAERPDHAKLRTRATLKQHLRDGRVIAVMHEPMPGGGSVATYQDITEAEYREAALREHATKLEASIAQARALRALAEQRDVLETTLESIRAGIATFDATDTVSACNGCFEEILRGSRSSMGPSASEAADEAAQGKLKDWLERSRKQPIEIEGANGKTYEVRTYPMPNRGHVLLAVDVSGQKLLQQRILKAKAEAEATSRAKSGFLASISHELRTPMNGVFGVASLLSRTELDPRQRGLVETLQQCAHGLFALIEDLLDISMIEQGRVSVCHEAIGIRELSEEVRTLVSSAHRDADLNIVVDISLPEAAEFFGDARRIKQILLNLIGNAAKFAAESEIRLSIAMTASGAVRFAVRDSGPGVAEDQQDAIFERFVQADMSPIRKHGGVGLGLAICKGLVEQMGGRIGVVSTLGKGAEFWFELPLERKIPRLAS